MEFACHLLTLEHVCKVRCCRIYIFVSQQVAVHPEIGYCNLTVAPTNALPQLPCPSYHHPPRRTRIDTLNRCHRPYQPRTCRRGTPSIRTEMQWRNAIGKGATSCTIGGEIVCVLESVNYWHNPRASHPTTTRAGSLPTDLSPPAISSLALSITLFYKFLRNISFLSRQQSYTDCTTTTSAWKRFSWRLHLCQPLLIMLSHLVSLLVH